MIRCGRQQRLQLLLVMLLVLLLSPVAMGAAGAEPAAAAADWWRALAPDFVGDWDLETELLPPQQAPPPDGPRGAPLAEGVIRLSTTQTSSQCRAQLNATCFGRCLEALLVNQLGPLHNLTSLAEHPISPRWPPRSQEKMPCHCPQGYGLYRAGTGSALWYFPGPTDVSPPRVLNITIGGSDGQRQRLVARHAALDGNRGNRSCPFVFEVTEGLVMGVKSPTGGRPSPHRDFPIWATILLAVAGVLLLGGIAFVVIRIRSASASSSSSTSASRQRRRWQQGGRKKEEGEEVASLQDPLLLGEEGKANEGRA